MKTKPQTYRELNYSDVMIWAWKKKLNTETLENYREAAEAYFKHVTRSHKETVIKARIERIYEKRGL